MVRSGVLLAILVAIAGSLAACGGPSKYCAAVQTSQKTLNSFGSERTDKAFAEYARTMRSIAEQAPDSSRKDWSTLASVTKSVLDTHTRIGISLEELADPKKRGALSTTDISDLNTVYKAFNNTSESREAVVADVQESCDIALK